MRIFLFSIIAVFSGFYHTHRYTGGNWWRHKLCHTEYVISTDNILVHTQHSNVVINLASLSGF